METSFAVFVVGSLEEGAAVLAVFEVSKVISFSTFEVAGPADVVLSCFGVCDSIYDVSL